MVETLPITGRLVRELRLRAASDEAARRSAIVLEDAIRVASLPGGTDGGRLVILRRVDLGRVPARASAACLALRLEQCCRATAAVVVESGVDASKADAVVFKGWADAIRLLAERWAEGGPVSEWFWPRVVPGWRDCGTPADRWRLLLRAALGGGTPVLAAAGVVQVALEAGRVRELLAALASVDPWPVFARCGWLSPVEDAAFGRVDAGNFGAGTDPEPVRGTRGTAAPDAKPAALAAPVGPAIPASIQALYRESEPAARVWLAWMVAMLEVRSQPVATSGDRQLAQRAWRRLAGAGNLLAKAKAAAPPDEPGGERTVEAPPSLTQESGPAGGDSSWVRLNRHPGPPNPEDDTGWRAPSSAAPTDCMVSPTRPEPIGGVDTGFGGLPFVIPVLQRLGFAAELEARPGGGNEALGVAVLWTVARRVGAGPDDSIYAVLRDWFGTGVSDVWIGEMTASGEVSDWIRRVRRWCRIEAGIGLASLVHRPARLRSSSTHLEVWFDLGAVDLRVRRNGLDIDPGWVPWIGRVVRYEYRSGDERWEYDD